MFEKLEEYEDEITLLILGPINFVMFSWVGFFLMKPFKNLIAIKAKSVMSHWNCLLTCNLFLNSFGMAYDFIDSVGNDVDVVSDSEVWTQLKFSHSNSYIA